MLDKFFKLKENKTTVAVELLAGLATFMSMSYIIFLNPAMLSNTGMNYNSVYVATILASAIGTLFLGLIANVPYVQSAGLGLNALFTFTICGTMGFSWQQALAMVFICGVINVIITLTSIRKMIIKSIPEFMQDAITVGIGLFITYIGIKSAGLIEFSVSGVHDGISSASNTVPQLATFNNITAILAIIGIIVTAILVSRKTKFAYIKSIFITSIIGIFLGVTKLPDFSSGFSLSLEPTFLQLDFSGLLSAKAGVVVFITLFTLVISDLFDTIGTFIGTGKKSGIFKMDEDGNMPKKLERALACDSATTMVGALLGTSNVTTYVESSVGIEMGGRTGLTAVSAALCFIASLFLGPIVSCVPMSAIAPILIFVGLSMIENIIKIDWKDILIAIPAFFVIVMMPLSYSITTGIQFGFIMYVIINIVNKKGKKVSPIIYIFTALFIFYYVYSAII